LNRSGLTLRRVSTAGRELPTDAKDSIENFIRECKGHIQATNAILCSVINMDETCVYLDAPSSYTYSHKGSKRIKATTTGNEHTRVSIAFAATANGEKLNPVIMIPRVRPLENFITPDNVIILYVRPPETFNQTTLQDGFIHRADLR
jgi:hypothetical protein